MDAVAARADEDAIRVRRIDVDFQDTQRRPGRVVQRAPGLSVVGGFVQSDGLEHATQGNATSTDARSSCCEHGALDAQMVQGVSETCNYLGRSAPLG